jgi:hypothetical protein
MLFYRNNLELVEESEDTVVVKVTMSKDKYLTMMAESPKQQLIKCFSQGISVGQSARLCKCDENYALKVYDEWANDKPEPEKIGKKWKKSKIAWWNSPGGIQHREWLSKQCKKRHARWRKNGG